MSEPRREYKERPVTLSERIARRAVEIFERNGGRYNREKLFRELMTMVPPGIAVRRNETDRTASGKYRSGGAPATRQHEISHTDAIRYGARSIVRGALNPSMKGRTAWVTREGDDLVYLRPPKIIVSDQRIGVILMPVLNALASTFRAEDNPNAWAEVQLMAHEHGLHLVTCPRNCKLVTVGQIGDLDE